MSLIVSEAKTMKKSEPIPEGTYLAVCNMLVDLGLQYSETYKKSQDKVLIGWEIPEITIEFEGVKKPRNITNRYTKSLGSMSTLRKDLAAWRGRDFTAAELDGFDLHNIIGTSCLLNVIHSQGSNGNTYANISSIIALPKGMPKGKLSGDPVVVDLDTAKPEDIDALPEWIGNIIRQSESYGKLLAGAAAEESIEPVAMEDLEDDGELPF